MAKLEFFAQGRLEKIIIPDRETQPSLRFLHLQRYVPDTVDRVYAKGGPQIAAQAVIHIAAYYECSPMSALHAWTAIYGRRRLLEVVNA